VIEWLLGTYVPEIEELCGFVPDNNDFIIMIIVFLAWELLTTVTLPSTEECY
jgi:hypothetical protein